MLVILENVFENPPLTPWAIHMSNPLIIDDYTVSFDKKTKKIIIIITNKTYKTTSLGSFRQSYTLRNT